MSDRQALSDYLDGLAIPDELDRTWLLKEFLAPLGIESASPLADLCEDILVEAVAAADAAFHMRPGGWRIDVVGTSMKTLLAASLLGAALFINGSSDVPEELLPAVLPLLIDMKRVTLNRQDRALLVPLRLAARGVEGMAVNSQVLYQRLDPAVRGQLSPGDFEDLCERLIQSGHLDDAGLGDVRARAGQEPAWIRLTWT